MDILQTILLVTLAIIYFIVWNSVRKMYKAIKVQDQIIAVIHEALADLMTEVMDLKAQSLDTTDVVGNLLDRSVQIGMILNAHSEDLESVSNLAREIEAARKEYRSSLN